MNSSRLSPERKEEIHRMLANGSSSETPKPFINSTNSPNLAPQKAPENHSSIQTPSTTRSIQLQHDAHQMNREPISTKPNNFSVNSNEIRDPDLLKMISDLSNEIKKLKQEFSLKIDDMERSIKSYIRDASAMEKQITKLTKTNSELESRIIQLENNPRSNQIDSK